MISHYVSAPTMQCCHDDENKGREPWNVTTAWPMAIEQLLHRFEPIAEVHHLKRTLFGFIQMPVTSNPHVHNILNF